MLVIGPLLEAPGLKNGARCPRRYLRSARIDIAEKNP